MYKIIIAPLVMPFFIFLFSIGFSYPLLSMQCFKFRTSDGKTQELCTLIISLPTCECIDKNKALFDGKLSANTWRLFFWLYALNTQAKDKHIIKTNPELNESPGALVYQQFIEHKVSPQDVGKLVALLPVFNFEAAVNDALLHAYVIYTKGNFDSDALLRYRDQFSNTFDKDIYTKSILPTLDKYYYLRDKDSRHLNLPILGTVSLTELLDHGKLTLSPSPEDNHFNEPSSSSVASSVRLLLCGKSIASLEGWEKLCDCIKPDQIYKIDLSNNCLESLLPLTHLKNFNNPEKSFSRLKELYLAGNKLDSIPPAVLQGCVMLKILNVSNNKLKTIPLTLLEDCTMLKKLDLSHNSLDELSAEGVAQLVALCTQLQELLLTNTAIDGTLTATHFANRPCLRLVNCEGSRNLRLAEDLQKKIQDTNFLINLSQESNFLGLSWGQLGAVGTVVAVIVCVVFVLARSHANSR